MSVPIEAKRIFDDLLTLEVNLILKPAMTGRKMPETHLALLDILGWYSEQLVASTRHIRKTHYTRPDPCVSVSTFEALRVQALALDRELSSPGPESILLKRIHRNCRQIIDILKRAEVDEAIRRDGQVVMRDGQPVQRDGRDEMGLTEDDRTTILPLTADEVLTVRKAWEVSTEEIITQTVVQLDGDIVTRIQPARAAANSSPLHALHREGLDNALKHWQFMFRTVGELAGRTLRAFLAP
jgi:hypothetical protein